MLVGYMRVSTDGDRQVRTCSATLFSPLASMSATYLTTGRAAAVVIASAWPKHSPLFVPAIA
jgi:hypothetical protein